MSPRLATSIAVLAGILAAAIASLALPGAPGYDAWAWLIWGREIASGTLDTSAGASWKPLTSLVAAPLSLLGADAPGTWLVIARSGWLAAAVVGFELARRLTRDLLRLDHAAAVAAGLIAALGIVLISDSFTSWTRQALLGLSEPLLAALVLFAAERELAGRRGVALSAGWLACLIRPEAWPFFLLYAAYAVWAPGGGAARVGRGIFATLAALALATLWFVPDLLGSGDPLEGAIRARDASGPPVGEFFEAIGRGLGLAIPVLWAGSVVAVLAERREPAAARRLRIGARAELGPVALLAALAAGWIAVVAAMAAGGYPGLPRFMAPAGAIGCVLGGAGVAWLIAARGVLVLRLAGAALIAAGVAIGVGRGAELIVEVDRAATVAAANASLDRLAVPAAELEARCGQLATTDFLYLTALAWRVDAPPSTIRVLRRVPSQPTALVSSDVTVTPRELRATGAERVSRAGRWSAYAIDCATASRSSRSSPGSRAGGGGVGGRR